MARIQELTMNRGSRMLLLLALGAGLLAAVLVFVALNNSGDSGSSNTSAPETTAAAAFSPNAFAPQRIDASLSLVGARLDAPLWSIRRRF